MDRLTIQALAEFCVAQKDAFDPDDWNQQFSSNRKAIALIARYLSMTSWFGHEEELEQIILSANEFVDTSHGLHRESQAIGFDLPYFSSLVRFGIVRARIQQEALPTPTPELAGALGLRAETCHQD